jgi:hypothetical protein
MSKESNWQIELSGDINKALDQMAALENWSGTGSINLPPPW